MGKKKIGKKERINEIQDGTDGEATVKDEKKTEEKETENENTTDEEAKEKNKEKVEEVEVHDENMESVCGPFCGLQLVKSVEENEILDNSDPPVEPINEPA